MAHRPDTKLRCLIPATHGRVRLPPTPRTRRVNTVKTMPESGEPGAVGTASERASGTAQAGFPSPLRVSQLPRTSAASPPEEEKAGRRVRPAGCPGRPPSPESSVGPRELLWLRHDFWVTLCRKRWRCSPQGRATPMLLGAADTVPTLIPTVWPRMPVTTAGVTLLVRCELEGPCQTHKNEKNETRLLPQKRGPGLTVGKARP